MRYDVTDRQRGNSHVTTAPETGCRGEMQKEAEVFKKKLNNQTIFNKKLFIDR